MHKHNLRFRQVHLDFHTSELIESVGEDFNKEEFVNTLLKAHVNSVTCFARCHHGWLYYDSKRFPEKVHPSLKNRNLLKEQIEVCHKNNIKVPVYISVMWDGIVSRERPEWLCKTREGETMFPRNNFTGFYTNFCLNSGYKQYIKDLTADVIENFGDEVDGLFYDILVETDCYCEECQRIMKEKGYHINNEEDYKKYKKEKVTDFILEMSEYIETLKKGISVYYNDGNIKQGNTKALPGYTHLEFDALPSSNAEGYNLTLLRSRFDRTLGLEYAGHTGKFHSTWGDLHSFKNPIALEYECFKLLSYGTKCVIGDQMLPNARLCSHTYDTIGKVYEQVEKKEPWCDGIKPLVDIGLLTPEEFGENRDIALAGARILEEAGHQFDIIDSNSEFSNYKLIILADKVVIDNRLKEKLNEYVEVGGKVIGTFESGLDNNKEKFVFDKFGVTLNEEEAKNEDGKLLRGCFDAQNSGGDYIIPKGEMAKDLFDTEYIMYSKCLEVSAVSKEDVLYDVIEPYYYRSQKHFFSHRQAPSSGRVTSVGAVKNDNCIYIAHPLFLIYKEYAPEWISRLLLNAIDMLLQEPILRHDGPPTLQTTVNEQTAEDRCVVHLLHYIPRKKARVMEVVDCKLPLYNVTLSLNLNREVKSVKLVPENIDLDFRKEENRIVFAVPKIDGHEMVEIK